MFGLSIGKLLPTALVVVVVFYGWKWVGRVQAQRTEALKQAKTRRRNRPTPPPAADAVDMVQCPVCGDYVPARGATSCGRDDCPYPG